VPRGINFVALAKVFTLMRDNTRSVSSCLRVVVAAAREMQPGHPVVGKAVDFDRMTEAYLRAEESAARESVSAVEIARRALGIVLDPASTAFVDRTDARLREIEEQVAERHGVTLDRIKAKSRDPREQAARYELWFLAYTEVKSLPKVGARYDRHHTAIMDGIANHRALLMGDERRAA
jgi:hypothetical protein